MERKKAVRGMNQRLLSILICFHVIDIDQSHKFKGVLEKKLTAGRERKKGPEEEQGQRRVCHEEGVSQLCLAKPEIQFTLQEH